MEVEPWSSFLQLFTRAGDATQRNYFTVLSADKLHVVDVRQKYGKTSTSRNLPFFTINNSYFLFSNTTYCEKSIEHLKRKIFRRKLTKIAKIFA
jgi:hypothetical protein